jgi:uncharacterized protein (DUF302 family)
MKYYISTTVKSTSFNEVEQQTRDLLMEQGFGVITEIDTQATFKNKLDIDFKPYKILGACNPGFAHKVLEKDDKMGVMLPCNVCIQQKNETEIEVFAINPLVAMKPAGVDGLEEFATEVYNRLNKVIKQL